MTWRVLSTNPYPEGWSAEESQRELEAELKHRRLQKEAQDAARAAAAEAARAREEAVVASAQAAAAAAVRPDR
jgi:hypothetical protein